MKKLWQELLVTTIIYSFVYKGPMIVKNIKKELVQILKDEGVSSLEEVIGKGLYLTINQYLLKEGKISNIKKPKIVTVLSK